MKFTVSAALLALATVSSAATIPAVNNGSPLPEKFTLVIAPTTGDTPLVGEPTQITTDAGLPLRFNFGTQPAPFYKQAPLVVQKTASKDTYYIFMDTHLTQGDLTLDRNSGEVYFNYFNRAQTPAGAWSQVNGGLAYNFKDGKGAQTLFQACDRGNASSRWTVIWDPAPGGFYDGLCYPISLKVVAL